QSGLCRGVHDVLFHGRARRGHHRAQPVGGAGGGRRCAGALLHRGGGRGPRQPRGGAGRRDHRGPASRDRRQPVPRARACGALFDRRDRLAGAPRGTVRAGDVSAVALRPAATRSPLWIAIWAVPIAALLAVLPWVLDPYRTIQLAYGLIFAVAGLGFNILLG